MDADILRELVWIKWLLVVIACVFVAIGASIVLLLRSLAKIPDQVTADASFMRLGPIKRKGAIEIRHFITATSDSYREHLLDLV